MKNLFSILSSCGNVVTLRPAQDLKDRLKFTIIELTERGTNHLDTLEFCNSEELHEAHLACNAHNALVVA
jgi:hypothetical protein